MRGTGRYEKGECELNMSELAWLCFLSALAIQVPVALNTMRTDGRC